MPILPQVQLEGDVSQSVLLLLLSPQLMVVLGEHPVTYCPLTPITVI